MVRNSFSSLMSPTTPPRRMLTTPVLTGDSGRAECATEKTFIDTNQHLISQGHANIILPTWRKVSQSVSAFMRCVMSRSMDVPTASNHYMYALIMQLKLGQYSLRDFMFEITV